MDFLHRDKIKTEQIVKSLNLKISARDSRHTDGRVHLKALFDQWLPLSRSMLTVVVEKLPNPQEIRWNQTQSEEWVIRNVFKVAPIGTTTSIAPVGGNLLLTSWLDNSVKMLDPLTGEILHSIENLNVPVSSAAFNGFYAVALHGNSSVSLLRTDGSLHKVLSSDFDAPTHVIPYEEGLLVSDRERGQLIKLSETGETQVVVDGLTTPEGIALSKETIFVFEGDTGEIKEVKNNIIRTIATLNGGSPAASSMQPPSMIFNGLASKDGVIYASDEKDRSIYRISLQ